MVNFSIKHSIPGAGIITLSGTLPEFDCGYSTFAKAHDVRRAVIKQAMEMAGKKMQEEGNLSQEGAVEAMKGVLAAVDMLDEAEMWFAVEGASNPVQYAMGLAGFQEYMPAWATVTYAE